MSDRDKPVSRPWWSYVRFSLRGLIVLVLVTGAWLGWIVRSARLQREAAVALQRAGCGVMYDWEYKDNRGVENGKPWWPRWLESCVGVDYLSNVVYVHLFDKGSDRELVHVGNLGRLEYLHLGASPVTAAGLTHLKGLTRLRQLFLIGIKLTDADVARLTDSSDLEWLDLDQTGVTDAGLAHLRGFKSLEWLSLNDARITDAGLESLNGLTRLSHLSLAGTSVSDAGLMQIKRLTNLKELYLHTTNVTEAGVRELQRALPNVKIER